jgi:hypothetical protein
LVFAQRNCSPLALLSAPGIQLRRLRIRASRIVQNRYLMVRVCAGAAAQAHCFDMCFLDVEVTYAAESIEERIRMRPKGFIKVGCARCAARGVLLALQTVPNPARADTWLRLRQPFSEFEGLQPSNGSDRSLAARGLRWHRHPADSGGALRSRFASSLDGNSNQQRMG